MTLQDTKSLREILDALINIVEYEKNLGLKIGIRKSSAAESIIGTNADLQIVYQKIKDAADAKPTRDRIYVNNLNVIRDNIAKKQDFEIVYKSNSAKKSLKPLFVKKFKTVRKRSASENNFNVQFFEGYLEENGGKKPNFHIISNQEAFTIQCTKEEAIKVNPFLYKTFHISAWAKSKNEKMEYEFCDIYAGNAEKYYHDFKTFFKDLAGKTGTEPFHMISGMLEKLYNQKDFNGAKKFIRIFLNQYSTPNYLRTILLISKGLKNNHDLSEILIDVENLLESKIGEIY